MPNKKITELVGISQISGDDLFPIVDISAAQTKSVKASELSNYLLNVIDLKEEGAVGDGVTDDFVAVQAAVDLAIQTGLPIYVPEGVYILGQTVRLDNLTQDNQGLIMRGNGGTVSIFKESPNRTGTEGDSSKMFWFYTGLSVPFPYAVGSFVFEDIGFDKNATTSTAPSFPFEWDQSHTFVWNGVQDTSTASVHFNRCHFFDKSAACINHNGSNVIDYFAITNCVFNPIEVDDLVWGERGDIELSGHTGVNIVNNVSANFMQLETVAAQESGPTRQRTNLVSNSVINVIQFAETTGDPEYSYLYIENTRCNTELSIRNLSALVNNSVVNFTKRYNYTHRLLCSNSVCLLDYDDATDVVSPTTIRPIAGSSGTVATADFSNCEFRIDADTVDAAATGYAVDGVRIADNVDRVKVTLSNCIFDDRLYGSVNAYGMGKFTLNNCRLGGHTYAVDTGAYTLGNVFESDVVLNYCDFTEVTGTNVIVRSNNTSWQTIVNGRYITADWSETLQGGSGFGSYYAPTLL